MRYAGIIKNDIAAAPGISLTFFTQGCPHHCIDCHNPETWSFDGGKEFTQDVLNDILISLKDNDIERSFCVMGGEPLCEQNLFLTLLVIKTVRNTYKDIPIYLWTGYYYEELKSFTNNKVSQILELIDILIDGPYDKFKRDITLKMRGSSNQSVIDMRATREKGEKVLCQKN